MSRISILNASVKDFAVEAVDSLPSGTSHVNGRIVKAMNAENEPVLYVWDS